MLKLLDLLVRFLTAFLTTKGPQDPQVPSEPEWLARARTEIGFHEVGNNRGIERYIEKARCGSLGDPWCAIFVNSQLEVSGRQGSRSAAARSFEHDERFMKLSGPALGCIATMWRGSPDSGLGHVFFYTGHDAQGRVWGIGGNESDGVREVPHDPSRIVGYYWPRIAPPAQIGRVRVDGDGSISTKEV